MVNQIYSSEKFGNGMVINYCRFSNGKVDYCTKEDTLRAMDVINTPNSISSLLNGVGKANQLIKNLGF